MKKICVVTGTRAEYGLLRPVMERIKSDGELILQVIVTGAHLSQIYGSTFQEIIDNGFQIDCSVDMALEDDTPIGISKSMSKALTGFTENYLRLKPSLVVLLGDRYEIFMAAVAATLAGIPIAHIHGGELTEGAIDDSLRHSVTKMSQLHFTSTEEYRKRVIQLGEQPDKVFNVGALGVENIKRMQLMLKDELEEQIDFKIDERTLLATFHPVTLEKNTAEEQFEQLLKALDSIEDITVIFTKANADTNGRIINSLIDEYVKAHPEKSTAFFSMGQRKYLSAMNYCGAVIGNSSSGIIEAPSLNVPTVNIGDRQKGRIQADSVINCQPVASEIIKSIEIALKCRTLKSQTVNPYEGKNTHNEIVDIIKHQMNNNGLSLKKQFYDLCK